jgi:predicted nucleotidyltransferase
METEMQDYVLQQMKELAIKHNIEKVVLFGSRARGDHSPVSDYDVAVWAEHLSAVDKARFCVDVEDIETLKKIDIVFIDAAITAELMKNIVAEGVVILEPWTESVAR